VVRAARRALTALTALVVAGCAAPVPPPPVPTGYVVALLHDERPVPGPDGRSFVEWRTTWELRWEPVPGAEAYAVRFGTSEGPGDGGVDRRESGARVRVEAATGTSPVDEVAQDREAGLAFTAAQLAVSVAAVAPGGVSGPSSPWFAVGEVPPDGRPAPLEIGHGH
jgi:hypothetical protein